jgi:hypothetical protein
MDNKPLYVLLGVLALTGGWFYLDRAPDGSDVALPRAGRTATGGASAAPQPVPGLTQGPNQAASAETGAAPADRAELERVNPRARVKLAALRETTQRPLFELDRRPVIVPAALPAPARAAVAAARVEPRADFQVAGIVAGGANPTVLIKRAGGGASLRVHKGDVIDGWTVEAIGTDQVTVRRDGTKLVMRLFGK